jgi:Ser/Thr protein kinase RdoA (MazF antagonist)
MQKTVLSHFPLDGNVTACERYGCGHINETYLVVTDRQHRYILQKINHHIFKDVPGLMHNIASVTEYLRQSIADPRRVLTLVFTHDGSSFVAHEDGSFWRLYEFVEGSICLQAPETPDDFYQSAVAFGTFQQQLKDFPAATLNETIPNFHNTVDRYRIFHQVLEADVMGRAAEVQEEIAFVLAREEEAGTLVRMLQAGELPLRVTHNDTKLNNVMLDDQTRTPLCVIDLDTVMPGLSAYDFGDSIRFGAATAAEDEQDLSKMVMDLERFRSFTKGFLQACPNLTENEKKMLPMGAKLMTLECGVRFLTDYLDGDHYFAIHREKQNLDRCRTQFKLVADMEEKFPIMHEIVKECAAK